MLSDVKVHGGAPLPVPWGKELAQEELAQELAQHQWDPDPNEGEPNPAPNPQLLFQSAAVDPAVRAPGHAAPPSDVTAGLPRKRGCFRGVSGAFTAVQRCLWRVDGNVDRGLRLSRRPTKELLGNTIGGCAPRRARGRWPCPRSTRRGAARSSRCPYLRRAVLAPTAGLNWR